MSAPATAIELLRDGPRRYHALVHRRDGVTVRLEGGSYNKIGGDPRGVPHDIAHFLVEESLDLRSGLWGVLAAGGLVQNAAVVSGRGVPHAAARSRAITRAASRALWEAEVVVRAVADVALDGGPADDAALRARCGGRFWPEGVVTAERLAILRDELRAAAERWWALGDGAAYELAWRLPQAAGPRR